MIFETLKVFAGNYKFVVGIVETLRVLANFIVSLKILDVFLECLGFVATRHSSPRLCDGLLQSLCICQQNIKSS